MYERGDLSDIEKKPTIKIWQRHLLRRNVLLREFDSEYGSPRENVGEFEILVSLLVGLIGLMSTLDTLLTDMGFGWHLSILRST